ncbi:helix-turn-helix domain-containing protein [Buttiauxella selenatireducens]|uniref:Helix-turn-helix domain-containing protein n=1 Tax=Buttiauxella selenatireducens TaxID=3073902 RepID=A0ABY9SAX3_9ENTR|nr:helix-turn-helix domain-containing protein [Buttiauxella sp. R73]WMY73222.1 helix-turn-helix domain-containing protein [Buttiauxella sp. R73]
MSKELLSGPSPSMIQVQATLDLVEKLSPHLTFEIVPPQSKFPYIIDDIPMCTVVRSGKVRVRRDSDEIVIASVPIPNIMGVGSLVPKNAGLYIETVSECSIASLTSEQVLKLIGQLDLWQLLSAHITKVANNVLVYSIIMTPPTAYEVIRFQLLALMDEDSDIRNDITAANYILQRTRLSRSSVMKILAELKKGEFIVMDEGRLIHINKLPHKY